MDVVLWVLQGVLAAAFLGAGLTKLLVPEEKLVANPNMAWVEDHGIAKTRTAGAFELIGVAGLILPGVTGVAPVLTPLAALGLATVAVLAVVTVHRPRKEPFIPPAVLGGLALIVAVGRVIEPVA